MRHQIDPNEVMVCTSCDTEVALGSGFVVCPNCHKHKKYIRLRYKSVVDAEAREARRIEHGIDEMKEREHDKRTT